ncbi:pro-sigmaK processing inhibitor BofA family protein [Pseudoneobacillus sp. C159]
MEPIVVISIIAVLILLLLLIGTPIKPLRFLGQGVIKILIGALLLFFLNAVGNQFGLQVPINLVTSAISGLLGVPGLAALVVIQLWII